MYLLLTDHLQQALLPEQLPWLPLHQIPPQDLQQSHPLFQLRFLLYFPFLLPCFLVFLLLQSQPDLQSVPLHLRNPSMRFPYFPLDHRMLQQSLQLQDPGIPQSPDLQAGPHQYSLSGLLPGQECFLLYFLPALPLFLPAVMFPRPLRE